MINRKVYNVLKSELLKYYDNDLCVDVKLASLCLNIPIHIIKSRCKIYQLKFKTNFISKSNKKILTIQCPCCSWSGNFQFSTHILKTKDEKHENWIKELKEKYSLLKSSNKISELSEMIKYHISKTVLKRILTKIGVLKKFKIIERNCPVCDWNGKYIAKHILETIDKNHDILKKNILNVYLENETSIADILNSFKVNLATLDYILVSNKIKTRTLHEAVINSIQHNRHNINAYGISGIRKDLNIYCRSVPEANFARILKFNNIEFIKEVTYNLYDENKKLISTYFLDFLVEDKKENKQGFEIKSYMTENGYFKNKEKIVLFTKQYPDIKLKVIFCNSQEWKDLTKKYLPLIPLWETSTKNLKTHPEIYAVDKKNL